uniref:DUF5641 domain-containing protein n=1 Tax=Anopheles dirus TaxID=7168 RepID=A0A182NPV1_9DIPT
MHGSITVTGVGKIGVQNTQVTKALVASKGRAFMEEVDFVVLDHITENQPCSDMRFDVKKLPNSMELADPNFNKKGPIDLLLGAEYFVDILQHGCEIVPACSDHPGFVKTVFGWVASGRTSFPKHQRAACHLVTADQTLENLTECLERFWTIEELPDKPQFSQQEKDCEESFAQFHQRDDKGRYIVNLPFKVGEHEPLGDSKQCATKRFLQLERRMKRDPSLGREYAAVIADYKHQGFLKKISVDETGDDTQQSFYLPHHPVLKATSTTTKVRPVFDGSAKTSNGVSLNEALLKGPVIQDSLLDLLLRFRMKAVALVADIKQMYLQVKVDPKHTRYQRILWREDPALPMEVYELQRVTFGLTPSSFLATRVLKQLAIDEGGAYPRAQKALLQNFYVDDFLGEADDEVHTTEVKELSKGRVIPPSSKLKKLGVFLDKEGLLRLGGRLSQLYVYALCGEASSGSTSWRTSDEAIGACVPPSSYAWWSTSNVGSYATRILANQRSVVNGVCRGCVTCFKSAPTTVTQPSGQIPESRATSARPFSVVGMDYCGPFYLRPVHRRAAAQKCYMAVFVCFAVKAIHLELVEDLSTAAFMAAFRRFVSRRGLPSKIEAQLNSRPLTPLSEDPSELNVLTPGHFLIGAPLTALPERDVSNQPENRLRRYQQLQRLVQLHWKRWQREYITELHNYGQRVSPVKNIVEGQIVLLKEDNVPVCEWPMGRIEKVFLGTDQITRVVRVRTQKGIYTRPTSKICVLPIEG